MDPENTDLSTGDDFTPEEAAAFAAMERGEEPGSAAGAEPPASEPVAQPAAAAQPGEVAPDQVVDPEDEGADDPEANKGRFVRHGAFHRERSLRKELQTQNAQLLDRLTRGEERMRILTEAMRAAPQVQPQPGQPQAPAAPPNPEEDIFGYAKHLEAQLAELRQGQQQMTEAQRQEREFNDTVGSYRADIARFAQAEPSFADAYQHLINSRAQELAYAGVPQAEISRTIQADEFALVRASLASGVSPAERVFQLAKLRGFAPKAAEPPAASATAAPPPESATDRAARLAAGQNAARSLSGAGGAPAAEMRLERLAEMSEAEFEAYAAKNPRRLAALMGG
ncbi:hypothetical protein [Methylobacterium nonmethylotrophicum]|uniref:Scaffolding protein n=1 Tax=Methylobacterium nonmethylotrophicum TaxID=1141884 RepID=A0A4Z0NFU3_9HYPH|nr:hypothetical protein [Methylobacterium nonmethylotrophicum]TGD94054.1 hypothetical protein EU555_32550 [Methylobacterium nonmethylotrophicum]